MCCSVNFIPLCANPRKNTPIPTNSNSDSDSKSNDNNDENSKDKDNLDTVVDRAVDGGKISYDCNSHDKEPKPMKGKPEDRPINWIS